MGDAIDILRAFGASGKPVLIEKTFPLRCSIEEFQTFLRDAKPHSAGVIGFYWGKTPSELKRSGTIADAIMLQKPND